MLRIWDIHIRVISDIAIPDLIKSGERGKYAKRYREGSNVVVIDSDLTAAFPNAKAVNDALREYLSERRRATL